MEWLAILLLSLQVQAASLPLRDDLRYKLESLYNEMDLLLRNQRSDKSDLARVERAAKALRVEDRIPIEPEIGSLRAELDHRAREAGVKLLGLEVLSKDQPKTPIPRVLYSDTPKFRLEADQIAQTIHLRLILSGDGPAIEQWIQKWPEDQLRLIEPEQSYERPGLRAMGHGRFQLKARAFRFRKIRFPTLKPRNPLELLPGWARRDPAGFAKEDPKLWDFVCRIQEKIPETPEPFEMKGNLLLAEARMDFFLSKAK